MGGAHVFDMAANDSQILSSTYAYGIFVSSLSEINWDLLSQEMENSLIYKIAVLDSNIFASLYQFGGLKYSNDFGKTWKIADTSNGLNNTSIVNFYVQGNSLYALTNKGVFKSSDSGNNWQNIFPDFEQNRITTLVIKDNNIFLTPFESGIYY